MSEIANIELNNAKISIQKNGEDYLQVDLNGPGFNIYRTIYIYSDMKSLKSLFTDMNDNWQGWTGSKHFKSVEDDFKIVAHHNGSSLIKINIEICSDAGSSSYWRMSLDSTIEVGSLASIASQLANL